MNDAVVRRVGSIVELHPEYRDEYLALHRAVWPEVLDALRAAHVRNYSIYLHDTLLFSYLEYYGTEYEADMGRLAQDEATQRWWILTMPMQHSLRRSERDDWWLPLPEVFHLD